MTKAQGQRFVQLINESKQLAEEFVSGSREYRELATAMACIMRARRIALEQGTVEDEVSMELES